MEKLIPPPQEKELPAPNEKLLRSPAFWERQGKIAKWLAIGSVIFFLLLLISTLILKSQKPTPIQPAQPPVSTFPPLNNIEISSDAKSILNAQTKEVIFTIEDTKNYLKNSGYEYNPDTFQTTNAKYLGDCFDPATLSNNKERIVFSTSCLPGDLPQAWIGIYRLPDERDCVGAKCPLYYMKQPLIKFLTAGSGRNFVWSADDKTITYEADLGLSGKTEIKTIDSRTGKILEKKK